MSKDFSEISAILETHVKMKKVMLKKGVRAAKAPCPHCKKGFLHGRLAGRKDHLHMWCDNCTVRSHE